MTTATTVKDSQGYEIAVGDFIYDPHNEESGFVLGVVAGYVVYAYFESYGSDKGRRRTAANPGSEMIKYVFDGIDTEREAALKVA